MKNKLICLASVLYIMTSCSFTKTTPETIRDITNKVESKDFTVIVNYANPMMGRQIYLNSEYDLRIKNDSAFAYLPYFGVAYAVPYGGDGGIKFAEPMIDYSISRNKKLTQWNIQFKVKAKESAFYIYMNVFNNGSSSISVNSFNKQEISFDGQVKR